MSNLSSLQKVKNHHRKAYEFMKNALDKDESPDVANKETAKEYYEKGVIELIKGIQVDLSGAVPEERLKALEYQERMKKLLQNTQSRLDDLKSEKPKKTFNKPKPKHQVSPSIKKPWNSGTSTANKKTPSSLPSSRTGNTSTESRSSFQNKALLKNISKDLLNKILETVVEPSANQTSFDDIVGLEAAKNALNETVILPALRPDVFTGLREPTKGLLLFGPPGNGKTLLAKAVANEAKATFFNISAAVLTSKWVGESEKMVKALFQVARSLQPSIIFIDEIDSLLRSRREGENDASRRLLNEFLLQFDGVSTSSSSDSRLLVMGATNRPHELDPASIRRFPKRLYIRLPEVEARVALIKKLLSKQQFNLKSTEIHNLAKECADYSFSDLTNLTKDAAFGPIREFTGEQLKTINKNKIRKISYLDFKNSLKQVRPSVPKESLLLYEDWNRQYGDTTRL